MSLLKGTNLHWMRDTIKSEVMKMEYVEYRAVLISKANFMQF